MATESTPTLEPDWRDDLAQEAPVSFAMAAQVFGNADPDLRDPEQRAGFFALWAKLSYEWADAFIAAGKPCDAP